MLYLQIRDLLKKEGLGCSINLEIVDCVISSLTAVYEEDAIENDRYFEAICDYVRYVWDNVNKTYTQLIADVVVDCIYHCFGYYQCKDVQLSYEDLKEHKQVDKIVDIYLDKYYDCE